MLPEGYHDNPRTEMVPLVPKDALRVLDVGCGAGAFARELKVAEPRRTVAGIEPYNAALDRATPWVDEPISGSFPAVDLPPSSFDAVVLNDVLEHMVDPWAALDSAASLVRPGGSVIASVPTVRSLVVLRPLLLHGTFQYRAQGVLDRTHLRWFTKRSVIDAFREAGLENVQAVPVKRLGGRVARVARLLDEEFSVIQYGVTGRRPMA
jgi:2-polyprenyl-3-methyl-5-hydroxy-6-metoxy-1,4-benzoquinol methylase